MEQLLLIVPVLLISIIVHEVAHAWVALREGDDTAYMLGRITLNPLPHIDLMGSVLVPLALFYLTNGFIFGWAKPVPVNPRKFRNYKRGDIRVSLAGIVSNLILTVLFTLLVVAFRWMATFGGVVGDAGGILAQVAYYGVFINLILAFFNLIPIPPLDGSHVLYHLLPPRLGAQYRAMGRYGLAILMLLVFVLPGAFRVLLSPVYVLMGVADAFIELWI
jgi:Zn-dependent protease